MKVLVTSKSFGKESPDALRLLADHGIEVVKASKPTLTPAEIAAEAAGCDALIVGNDVVDAGVFAHARLRLVHMNGTGLDGIDVPAATRAGVLVANVPGMNRNAVAELTVALMLIASRSIHRHMASLAAGRWEREPGFEITGKTVGLLGLGNIGKRVVELLAGFTVRAVAYDPFPDSAWAETHDVTLVAEPDAVFAAADYLVLALPLTAATRGIVDARRLALMHSTAFVVNTARGGLIDEPALCEALRSRRIAGAALDTFDPEPLAADSPLRDLGIVLTPHLAASSREAAARISLTVAENVVDVLVRGRDTCAVNAADVAQARRAGVTR
jgi:D-3-phosphoglycerate dehydrogenase